MANQLTNTNQIAFLHGSESNLQALRSNATNIKLGAFYITNDTNRMYLGVQDGQNKKIVPLNQGVITIDKVVNLPTSNIEVGYFYYATKENVLCVYNGQTWVQINPDTNTYVTEQKITAETKSVQNGHGATITNTLTRNDNDQTLTGKWNITSDNTIELTVTDATQTSDATINFKCVMALKTVKSGTNDNFGKIVLSKDGTSTTDPAGEIKIAGDDYISVSSDGSGNISLGAETLHNADIKSISTEFNDNGELSTTVTLQENDKTLTPATVTPQIKLKTSDTNSIKFANGTAVLGVYSTTEVDNLITNQLAGLNPMRYMGLTGDKWTDTELLVHGNVYQPKNVALGDTYRVDQNNTYTTEGIYINSGTLPGNAEWAKKGDLFIATGDEEGGKIVSNFKWDHIPSGDDGAITYEGVSVNHGIKIQESASSGTQSLIAQLTLEAGDSITLTDIKETPTDNSKTNTVKIAHSTVTRSDTADTTAETQAHASKASTDIRYSTTTPIEFIDEVITNPQGHVTKTNTKKIELIDTNASMKSVTLVPGSVKKENSTEDCTDKVTLTNTTTLAHYNDSDSTLDQASGSIYFASNNSNLQLSASTDTITMNLVWGTF